MLYIVRATWTEILRKKVLLVTVLLSLGALGLFFVYVHMQQKDNFEGDALGPYLTGTLAVVMGLYLTNFTVAFLSIFSSAGTISSEIESGLLLAILPRPLPRWHVYLGKWIGYAVWSVLYGAVMYWTIIFVVYQQLGYPLHWGELMRAFGLFELVPLVLVSITSVGSLFLPSLGNGIAMTLLFMVGVMGGFLGRLSPNATGADNTLVLVSNLIMPADAAYHRMVYELMGGNAMPQTGYLGPLATAGIVPSMGLITYTVVYIVVAVGLGMVWFARKDV